MEGAIEALALVAGLVALPDALKYPDPGSNPEPPTPPPFEPGAPMPLTSVQKGLVLTYAVTVVTYCASVSVASLLKSARRRASQPCDFMSQERVEAQGLMRVCQE